MMKFLPSSEEHCEILKTLIDSIKKLDCIKSVDIVNNTIILSVLLDRFENIKSCLDKVFDIKDVVDPEDYLYKYCVRLNIVEEDENGNQI